MAITLVTTRIGIDGGYEIVIDGAMPAGVDIPVRVGPAGDATDPLCYGGPGLGYAGQSADGLTMTVYSPPLPTEEICNVTVDIGGLAIVGTLEVVAVPIKTAVESKRKLFVPWMAVGPKG